MKILITEDDVQKRDEISNYLADQGVNLEDIIIASNMADFMIKFDDLISLCIIDLRIPAYDGAGPEHNGIGVLQAVDKVGGGRVKLLAISSYPQEFSDIRGQFESRGCLLVDFHQKEIWKNVLKQMILQMKNLEVLDFIIFCALRAERKPFTAMPELCGIPKFRDNLSRWDVSLTGKRGTIIELPRMGLVDASVVAGACIEKFKPKVVAMSGICAGFSGRAELGQLLVSELTYEYQSGKWTTDGFAQEPYQVPISEKMRIIAKERLEDPELLPRLENGWRGS